MNLKSKFKSDALTTFAICLVVLFPLYRIIWNSYALIFLALVLFFQNFSDLRSRRALKERLRANKIVFLKTTVVFYPFLLSLLYTEDIQNGMGAIERMLPIIVFPFLIFFFIDSISKRQIDKILTVFLLGCMAHSMYLNFEFLRLGLFENFQEATFYELPFREAVMNLDFEPLHPTYVSLWYCFAIAIALSKLRDYKNQFLKTACVAAMFILLTTIVLLSSRIGLLCLATIGILYIFSVRNKKIKIVLLLLFAGVGLFSITKISLISSRMIAEFQQTELVPPVGKEHNSINIRIGIYKCAVNLIKQHVWLGVGIGDVQHELDTCYLNYQTDVYQSDNYNTHNFFLHSFLGAGFLAFLALVFMMWFFFDTGIRQKSILYISFVLIIFLGMLFENVLSRNHGIIFFGIFNTLFIQYYLLNPKYVDRGYSSLQQ